MSQQTEGTSPERLTFSDWFIHGPESGWKHLKQSKWWFHVLLGVLCAFTIPYPLSTVAMTVFLPYAFLLIGLIAAWTMSSHALLRTSKADSIASIHPDRFVQYTSHYRITVFILTMVLVLWSLVVVQFGFNLVAKIGIPEMRNTIVWIVEVIVYGASSLSIGMSWRFIFLHSYVTRCEQAGKPISPTGMVSDNEKPDSDA